MTEEGHRTAAEELGESRAQLERVKDIRLYTEASFGIGHHLISAGSQRRFGAHIDNHEGMARWLRERGEEEMANHIAELEGMRLSRWYGRRGNGDAADRQDQLVEAIAAWSLA